MVKFKKSININELKIGMITANEILSDGKVLIGKNVSITTSMIEKLNSLYSIGDIEIYCNESDVSPAKKLFEETERILDDISVDIEFLFDNVQTLESSGVEDIKKYSSKLLREITTNNNILKNIILLGSGDDCIYRHSVNVATLSFLLGKWINLKETQLHNLVYASILHDFGKTKINKAIVYKPGILTSSEFDVIKSHPTLAYQSIKSIPYINQSVIYGVLMHHERLDGSGYPLGLQGDQIHLFGRIIAIADMFDAINSDRTYKKRRKPFEALEIIKKESLGKLDYVLCNTFLQNISNFYIGQEAKLNNGVKCKIIQIDPNYISTPLVLSNDTFIDLKTSKGLYIEQLL